ncbi:TIM44-like domain-containing protein [Magnetospirillum sp. 15-1]|uniref:Tim44 domain-containing protein n=1 Tax=Magnetospirillum sp. 15-1 TaxID=1979370 RepID=UPI000BBC1779|nr:TIM44-like domain-containing protein [Magnetospirillum sp. 15-1]
MRHVVISAVVALVLALAGAGDALAKAGSTSKSSGGSFGSRGSRTYDAPMERTLAPPPAQTRPAGPPPPPQAAPRPGAVDAAPLAPAGAGASALRPTAPMGAPMGQPGFFQRNPFMAGLAGGLVGAGIGSMLFGHSPALAAASDVAPGASFLGLLLQLAIIGGLAWLAFRLFRSRTPSAVGPAQGNPYMRATHGEHVEPMIAAAPAQPRIEREFAPSGGDQEAFTEILLGVQKAWSDGNLMQLKRFATPEVVSFLSEDMSRNASEGVANKVENVALLKGDVSESWSEGGFDYLTAILTFSCNDYMVRLDTGAVADGNPSATVTHTEAWTFVRSSNGGRWLLSAVQQVQ